MTVRGRASTVLRVRGTVRHVLRRRAPDRDFDKATAEDFGLPRIADSGPVAADANPLAPDDRRHVLISALERITYLTQLADGKAAPLLALQATLAAVTVASADNFAGLFGGPALVAQTGAALLIGVYASSAAVVLALTLSVYFPVLSRGHGSVLFFEDVRHMPFEQYARQTRSLTENEVEDDLMNMIHASSAIASTKFHQLRWAYVLSAISLATWLPLMGWANF